MPGQLWRELMDHHWPNSAWIALHRDVFDRLCEFKRRNGLPTWEQALDRLLDGAEAQSPAEPAMLDLRP
jgi:hypothetical protein